MDNMDYDDCIQEYGTYNQQYCEETATKTEPTLFDNVGNFFGAIFGNWPTILGLILLIIFLAMSLKVIRQKEVGVVERLGRYNRSLQAGLHMIIPIIEKVAHKVDLEQYNIDVPTVVKTKEDQVITLPVVAMVRVIPEQASDSVYEVDEPDATIAFLISNEIKAKAATMTLQDIYDDRESITATVLENLAPLIKSYGFDINKVVIDNPKLSKDMEQAFNDIFIAEKQKVAATAQGEALRIKLVAKAEAEGASLEIQGKYYAVMRNLLATTNGSAIAEMIKNTDLKANEAMAFLANIDNNDAIRDAAASEATIVLTTGGNNGQATLGMLATAAAE